MQTGPGQRKRGKHLAEHKSGGKTRGGVRTSTLEQQVWLQGGPCEGPGSDGQSLYPASHCPHRLPYIRVGEDGELQSRAGPCSTFSSKGRHTCLSR